MKKKLFLAYILMCSMLFFNLVQAKKERQKEVVTKDLSNISVAKKNSSQKVKKITTKLSKDALEQDKIVATIYPPTEGKVILLTKKDCERLSINGQPQVIKDLVFKHIFFDQAKYKYKMDVSLDRAEKQIEEIMRFNRLTRDQMKAMFKESGYTYDQALQELTINGAVEHLLQYKIKSRIVITDAEIEKYYKNNPQYTAALYTVQVGFIGESDISEQEKENWQTIKDDFDHVAWSDEIVLADDEIAQERDYIKQMNGLQIGNLEEVEGGFEVVKLVKKNKKRLKTLEEMRPVIVSILRQQQFGSQLQLYKNELMKEYEVVYHS